MKTSSVALWVQVLAWLIARAQLAVKSCDTVPDLLSQTGQLDFDFSQGDSDLDSTRTWTIHASTVNRCDPQPMQNQVTVPDLTKAGLDLGLNTEN